MVRLWRFERQAYSSGGQRNALHNGTHTQPPKYTKKDKDQGRLFPVFFVLLQRPLYPFFYPLLVMSLRTFPLCGRSPLSRTVCLSARCLFFIKYLTKCPPAEGACGSSSVPTICGAKRGASGLKIFVEKIRRKLNCSISAKRQWRREIEAGGLRVHAEAVV